MPKRRENSAELHAKIASLENLRPELGEEFVNQKINELMGRIQIIQSGTSAKGRGRAVGRDQSLQSGDGSMAVQGDVNDSTIVHAQTVVIADRFFDSTTVYQGVGRKIPVDTVAFINRFAVGDCLPDLTLIIDLDPRVGLERARGRELFDRMENQSLEFYERVRQGYLDLAQREPGRVKVIDGSRPIVDVWKQIWEHIARVF